MIRRQEEYRESAVSGSRGPDRPSVEIIEREVEFEGFFRLERYRLRHRLFDGSMSPVIERELFERGHAAALLPYDPVRDTVVLLEQFRIGALEMPGGPWLLEAVAGIIEPGESAEDVVRRESQEEAGCTVTDLEPICRYLVSPGGTSETLTLFCGRVDSRDLGGIHGLESENEDIRVSVVPLDQALAWLEEGVINSAGPIIALQWLRLNRQRLQRLWCAAP
ncbi:ADP-ribose diphosphatase [Thiohalomonas denitrificans]|uniref:ADP-ribose diphosphatase n=1 Tax=Thiohalomonas denitrificans TaxID=415747 RepID=UPI0039831563